MVGRKFDLDHLKKTIWLTRPDLRRLFETDSSKFDAWAKSIGPTEYMALREHFENEIQAKLLTRSPIATSKKEPFLTVFMQDVLETRSDLQECFNINTAAGQEDFIWWYFIFGPKELNIEHLITPGQLALINKTTDNVSSNSYLPISHLMYNIWKYRSDLKTVFDIHSPDGQQAFLDWYFSRGVTELGLSYCVDGNQAEILLKPATNGEHFSRIISIIWHSNADFRSRFGQLINQKFVKWLMSQDGRSQYPIISRLIEIKKKPASSIPPRPKVNELQFGVNLIGYAKGQLGIGEDVRMAALALKSANIPHSIFNVSPGQQVCQSEDSVDHLISKELPYSTNIFCMTGIETARLAAIHGAKLFDGRRTIGYWPWELPDWPAQWHHAYHLVDEIWASSYFTYNAFVKTSPVPVKHMPMAVTVDQTAGLSRRDFDISESSYLFIFSFDFLSSTARKNPEACIEAFRKAFPNGDENVGLIVKAMRAEYGKQSWSDLQATASIDPRIRIVSGTLSRSELLDLYRCCNCYLSLHRSEGFGRGIAEAMMLGLPVIATGYSGNMDYTLRSTAGLVDYTLSEVKEGQYQFGEGLLWANPSVHSAIKLMRFFYQNRDKAKRITSFGQQLTSNTYDPTEVGERYLRELSLHDTKVSSSRYCL
ncbi:MULTISPECIES: glycosyltransferase family 4 protein [unclassified Roseibium]|uniref:glycosyltransferase family 4 protein n=1 Tax=unclassified Roseibium TaxID=2629323 RepID=UPI00273E246F|nr:MULTISPECIES: glycosyltransferase family 4 protein [unclassified Roseibium]